MSDVDLSTLPTEFRGCTWDDGWEFDAPCVIYYPSRYACAGEGNNSGGLDYMVEDICNAIGEGEDHDDGGLDGECEWRGWSRRGFARRRRATHVVFTVQWSMEDGRPAGDIVARTESFGPPQPPAAGTGE